MVALPRAAHLVASRSSSVSELDDVTLERARRGDARAFRAVVERYQRPVHALLGRMLAGTASFAEVEELAQDTFVRIFRALPSFSPQGEGRLTKWVLTIATRVGIDWARRRRPRTAELHDSDAVSKRPGADEIAAGKLLASALARAVAALPEDQRAVFVLREYHDFDYEEMAEALGISRGTVKSRLSRARAALRERLSDDSREGSA